MPEADVCFSTGHAVIYDGEKIFTLKAGETSPQEQAKNFNVGMYLQPGLCDCTQVEVAAYPYADLQKMLAEEEVVKSFLELLDLDLPLRYRKEVTPLVEEMLLSPEYFQLVKDRLLSRPKADRLSLEDVPDTGMLGEIKTVIQAHWGH